MIGRFHVVLTGNSALMLREFSAVALMLAECCAGAQPSGKFLAPAEALPVYTDGDAYALYSSLLRLDGSVATLRLIRSQTVPMDKCIAPNGPLAEKVAEADAESLELNQQSRRLQDSFTPQGKVRLLASSEINELWSSHPDFSTSNVVSFSAVGFSKDRTVAVLFESEMWNGRGGSGGSHALVRNGDGWKEIPNQANCYVMY